MTELYHKIIKHAESSKRGKALELAHTVWDPTPWVIDVYIGERNEHGTGRDENALREWCSENIGKESWPIHGRPGKWYRGGATVDGWTWFGFATQADMEKFIAAWPNNVKGSNNEKHN